MSIDNRAEAELAVERLLDKHQKWLLAQPELLLIWTQDRPTRHALSRLIAKELVTIPVRELNENTPPNRVMRRAMFKVLENADPKWWTGVDGLLP